MCIDDNLPQQVANDCMSSSSDQFWDGGPRRLRGTGDERADTRILHREIVDAPGDVAD